MKYFLRNIAQSGSLRTIIFILFGLAMWVYAAVCIGFSWALVFSAFLLIVNALLASYLFSQLGITNLLTPFVATTCFLLPSALLLDHTAWSGQLCVLGMQFILLLLQSGDVHTEMVEQSFLSTLVVALLCFINPLCSALLLVVWLMFLFRHTMTTRVFLASLIALALVVLYTYIFHRLSWIDCSWSSFIARWHNLEVFWSVAVFLFSTFVVWLSLRRPSILSGIIYSISLLSSLLFYTFTQILQLL